jgi:hypothetical protein
VICHAVFLDSVEGTVNLAQTCLKQQCKKAAFQNASPTKGLSSTNFITKPSSQTKWRRKYILFRLTTTFNEVTMEFALPFNLNYKIKSPC